MRQVVVSRGIAAGPARVWARLADLADHPSWMADAESVSFGSTTRRGAGTVMEVRTRIGPFPTTDRIMVTGWKEGRSIEVAHQGLVKGVGALSVAPAEEGSMVTWSERLRFPWWLGGGVTALLARPVLKRVWAGNLRRLAELVE